MIRVAVGSTNPVKIRSALQGIATALKIDASGVSCEGFAVGSDVSDQPIGDDETKLGAANRARRAFTAHFDKYGENPTYSIGLEGGVGSVDEELHCFAWMVIFNGKALGSAKSASFPLPPCISDLVKDGMELGAADDQVFGTTNAKQGDGTVGHFTRNVVDRTKYYEMAVVLAMIPFLWPDLYRP